MTSCTIIETNRNGLICGEGRRQRLNLSCKKPRPDQRSSDGIDRTGRGRGPWLVFQSDTKVGYEAPSLRIFDQMQNAVKEVVLSLGSADVDNGGILEPGVKETNDAIARVVVQSIRGLRQSRPSEACAVRYARRPSIAAHHR